MWLTRHRSAKCSAHLTDGLRLRVQTPDNPALRHHRFAMTGQLCIHHDGDDPVVVQGVVVTTAVGDRPERRIAPASMLLHETDGTLSFVTAPVKLAHGATLTALYDTSVPAVAAEGVKTTFSARAVVFAAGRRSPLMGRQKKRVVPGWRYATPDDQPGLDFTTRALRAQLMSPW